MAPRLLSCPLAMNRTDRSPGPAGFTLIELLIVLALMSVLMFLSVPPLFQMVQRQKILGAVQQTAMAMRLARLEAIKTSTSTIVQINTAKGTVLAFADQNLNGVFDSGEPQLYTMALPRGVTFGTSEGWLISDTAVFLSNGATTCTYAPGCAFRFVDAKGDQLEVRVTKNNANQIKLRKELSGSFYEQGEGGKSWVWK
jgi:prepilin-type N-terminal cleavage/methylation domain-containing protein